MHDIIRQFAALRRPKLLMRAAQAGQAEYLRGRDLRGLSGETAATHPATTLSRLLTLEAEAEAARQNDWPTYSVSRHIDLLIALLGEFALLRRFNASDAA